MRSINGIHYQKPSFRILQTLNEYLKNIDDALCPGLRRAVSHRLNAIRIPKPAPRRQARGASRLTLSLVGFLPSRTTPSSLMVGRGRRLVGLGPGFGDPLFVACAAMFSLLAVACSDTPSKTSADAGLGADKGSSSDVGCAGALDTGIGNPEVLVGTFQVRLVPPTPATTTTSETPGYTSVVGKIYDGPTPSQTVWEEAGKDGPCRFLTPRVPFCTVSCGGSAVCVENDTCQKYPTAHSVGTVQVTGVHTQTGTTTFSMNSVANNYQPLAGVSLPYPAFSEGEEIRFDADGGCYVAPFTLKANGVSPLLLSNESISLATNQAVKLSWTAPEQSNSSKIYVKLDISHHGGTKGKIECETEDNGSLEISASFITQLLKLGAAGFPTIVVTRSTTGSATISAGRVDLVVSSEVEKEVLIPGVTSCNKDTDCPSDQKCQKDLTCKS
jgi:hypothetical protein